MYSNKEVFISYKSEEYEQAKWVKQVLEQAGISCWMAPECISGGSSYAVEIPVAIQNCKVFVLILSEKAQTSKWVPRELDQAINEEKRIMPFMVENCLLKKDFEFYLRNVQRYPAYENRVDEINKMILEIKALLAAQKEAERIRQERIKAEKNVAEQAENKKQDTEDIKKEDAHITEHGESQKEEKKQEKGKETNEKQPTKSKKSILLKFGIATGVLTTVILAGILLKSAYQKATMITIAGKEVEKDAYSLSFNDTAFTEEDLKTLCNMEELGYLSFQECTFPSEDLSSFNLLNLYQLTLNDCGISDEMIDSIDFSQMENLYCLFLNGNPELTNLEEIQCLAESIEEIDIGNTGISNIEFLEDFTRLEYFAANNNNIEDISALENSTKMKTLHLDGNLITSLEKLSGCVSLETVSVNNNQLTNLKGLEQSIYLKYLAAEGNKLVSLEGLENATLLYYVNLNKNELTDISVLGKTASQLTNLYLGENEISDISILKQSVLLEELNLNQNQVQSLEALEGCLGLQKLRAEGNQLTSLKGLKNCEVLAYIDVSDNQVEDIAVLSELSIQTEKIEEQNYGFWSGMYLDVSNNKISQLYSPKEVKYSELHLYGNEIASLDAVSGCEIKELIFDYYDTIDLARLESKEYYILNCPLDKRVSVEDILGKTSVKFVTAEEIQAEKSELRQWP